MEIILTFLRELKLNNNREWFNKHKDRYESAKFEFEKFCSNLISRISVFEPDFKI
ncbi:MAG: DUF2461 domain-containing protein [Porphyromonadaceae bacterium]|nr:DUF2461 domain-containing protein [Porphyromonadaceae bacterium]